MVISHKYRFIFVKTAKTAGTSIEVFLSGVCGEQDVFTPIFPPVAPHRARNFEGTGFENHLPAAQIRKIVGDDIWSSYYKFCVERNPWDKTLSHFHMLRFRSGEELTLEQYFENKDFCANFGLYTDDLGAPIVDRILRYEHLNDDLSSVFTSLGIPFAGTLGVRAKAEYRDDHRPYKEVLSESQARLIEEVLRDEIALLGYEY
jgi:hypothetical protein